MLGKDFFVYWQIGRAVLAGLNPYAVPESLYPPATTLLFAPLALLPFALAFALWTGAIVGMLIHTIRRLGLGRRGLAWAAYTPTVFVLLTGQMDLIFLWLGTFLLGGGVTGAVAGALVTLKPQAALVLLPWILWRWVQRERKTALLWLAFTTVLHTIPLLVRRDLYVGWLASISGQAGWRLLASPGMFSLTSLGIPWWILAPIAVIVAVWGLTRAWNLSRASQLLALPMGLWYEDVLLLGSTPWWVSVPASWIAFAAAAWLQSSLPLAAIAAIAWGWLVYDGIRHRSQVVESPA